MKEGHQDRTKYIPEDAFGGSIDEGLVDGVRKRLAGTSPKKEWQHFTPEFVGTKVPRLDIRETQRLMGSFKERFQEARISQPEGRIEIATNLPISISFVGDVHLGSTYTDHEKFFDDMAQIAETPNSYVVFMSNLIDNAVPSKFPANLLVNSIPPDKQVVVMRSVVEDMDKKGKVLGAVTSDCHEGWTWAATGQDVNALIYGYEGRRFPVLENGGRLHTKVGEQEYLLALYHKIGPFRSNFNYTHGLKQMNRLSQNMEADVTVGAHYHVGAVEEVFVGDREHRKTQIYVQSGTYKGIEQPYDQWSVAKFGRSGQPGAQTVELFPTERILTGFNDFETAMLAHECFYIREMVKTP